MDDLLNAEQFYNRLSRRYDDMTDFEARRLSARHALESLVRTGDVRRAADMGCGTGVHVLALAELGIEVLGIDVAEDALALARTNVSPFPGRARFERGDFRSPLLASEGPFDLILCLGNTLPHLESPADLREVLCVWRGALAPNGMVVVQLLNYDRILRSRERVINIRRMGGRTIVRFYDFTSPRLGFNILTIEETESGTIHDLQSTLLTPLLRRDVEESARAAGFQEIRIHSSLALAPWTEDAKDVVAVFREHAPTIP